MKSRFSKRFGKITAVFLSACVIAGGGLAEIGGIAGSGIGTLTAEATTPDIGPAIIGGECGAEGDNVTFTLDSEGTLIISGKGEMKNYSNSSSENVAPWNSELARGFVVEKVLILDGVTSIGDYAFWCSSLTEITIPSSVTSIGDYAFYESNLKRITIPDSVTSIGKGALDFLGPAIYGGDCGAEGDNVRYTHDSEGTLIISGKGDMKNYSSKNPAPWNSELAGGFVVKKVLILDGVTSIGDYAFESCSSLTEITIPSSVTSIGKYAFYLCKSLTNITIPDSVTSIGCGAFDNCTSLTDITIPNGVTSIEDWTFNCCESLTNVIIPDSVTRIGEYAFRHCTSLKSVMIPKSVDDLGPLSFGYYFDDRTWSFTTMEDFTICGFAETAAETYANENGFDFVPVDFVNRSTLSTPRIFVDHSVTVTGNVFGGEAPYKYVFYYKKSTDSSYTQFKALNTTAVAEFTPETAGVYTIRTKVKDKTGKVAVKDLTLNVLDKIYNTSTISSQTITLGETITVTGSVKGGAAPYKYSVYYKKATDSKYVIKSNSGTTNKVTIKPQAAVKYNVVVDVTDECGTVARKEFLVTVTAPLENTTTISSTSFMLGKSVTVTGSAAGGEAPYKYVFYYKKSTDSSYTQFKALNTTAAAEFTPETPGVYTIRTKVKDKTGKVAVKDLTLNVLDKLYNTSTISSETITLGETITVTGSAAGGVAPYKYSVYYKKATDSKYVIKSNSSTTNKVTIKPQAAVKYIVVVEVTDECGTVSRKEFTVTVNPKLKNTSELSASTISFGDTVTVTASATGGITPYQYAFYYKEESAAKCTTAKGYSSSDKVTILPLNNTNYNIVVKVKDAAGTVARKEFLLTVTA